MMMTTQSSATFFDRLSTPLGELIAVGSERAIHGLYFASAPHARGAVPTGARRDPAAFERLSSGGSLRAELEQYFAGERLSFDVTAEPLTGTPFEREVWRALRDIPYGETITYQALAIKVGRPSAARAVGAANGKNPISILIPCHRVIGHRGELTGYAGGMANKARLLELEGRRRAGA